MAGVDVIRTRSAFLRENAFIQETASLVRFGVLYLAWGTAGFDYKLFMDLSVRGLILSLLFFATSILVFVGYKTRAAMLGFAVTLLIHGLLFYHKSSLAASVPALLSAMLPIGAYYSVDRLLQVGSPVVPYRPDAAAMTRPLATGWKALFVAVTLFIAGGPVYNQILHHDSKAFLNWDMFHVIGRNFVNATFYRVTPDGRERIDYLTLLGHDIKRPEVHRNYAALADMRIVGGTALNAVITRMCRRAANPSELRVDARIATLKQGWRPLYDDRTPICTPSGEPLLTTPPPLEAIPGSADDDG